jgi:ComF family protein
MDAAQCCRSPSGCQPMIITSVDRAVDALFGAERCRWCESAGAQAGLCAACANDLPWNHPACPQCAMPQASAGRCGNCAQTSPGWVRAWAAFRYQGPVMRMIHDLKYEARFAEAHTLSALMAQSLLRRSAPLPEYLLPVPLHPARLRQRGYNQALELAKPLARRLGMRLIPQAATRLRNTGDQTQLSAAERRRNLRHAFDADSRQVNGRRIAILDDVMTTGATAAELTRALKGAGAAEVEVWACARTP